MEQNMPLKTLTSLLVPWRHHLASLVTVREIQLKLPVFEKGKSLNRATLGHTNKDLYAEKSRFQIPMAAVNFHGHISSLFACHSYRALLEQKNGFTQVVGDGKF